MLRKILAIIMGQPKPIHASSSTQMSAGRRRAREREFIKRESRVGATVFGAVPAGHQRDFFCLDQHTWIWSEQWHNSETKQTEHMTIRYEFQPRGVLKMIDNVARGYVEGQELTNLLAAIKTYHDRVAVEVYGYTLATT